MSLFTAVLYKSHEDHLVLRFAHSTMTNGDSQGSSKFEEQFSSECAHQSAFGLLTALGEVRNLEKFC